MRNLRYGLLVVIALDVLVWATVVLAVREVFK